MKKKKVAIISLGYLWFPCESGPSRFYQIANMLVDYGYEVECITTSFQHFKKVQRDKKMILNQGYPFKITFIDSPSYKRNVGLKRIYSNRVSEINLKKYLEKLIDTYDVIYTSIPANNIAAMVTTMAKKHKVPVIVDIEDLWPEAMAMLIKNEKIRNTLLYSFLVDAEKTYKNASVIVGTSEDYTNRAFKSQNDTIPHKTVYVGNFLDEFDLGVKEFAKDINKSDKEFWITYAGSLGKSYDIETMILAAAKLEERYPMMRFKILGYGCNYNKLVEMARKRTDNVEFMGYVEYKKMAAFLSRSDVLINSVVRESAAGIINKIGDYLAAGKPMINTESNKEFCYKVDKECFGKNIEAENVDELVSAIEFLYKNDNVRNQMGENARRVAESEFDRSKTYPEIINLISNIIAKETKQ